jgi:poly-gamma-glutamate capsule biosynthesis protein CapA/YwtB (metallophosphatase superfamily)
MLRFAERYAGWASIARFMILAASSLGGATSASVALDEAPRPAAVGVTLIAGGDILLDRGVRTAAETSGDPAWSFRNLPPLFVGADIVVANLECPLSNSDALILKQFMFRGDPSMARRMRDAGFTALSLANNHAYDAGRPGFVETMRHLEAANILPLGGGKDQEDACCARIVRTRAGTVALLAFADLPLEGLMPIDSLPGPARFETERAVAAVRAARSEADWVVVSMHWGLEYARAPVPRQEEVAQLLAREGVDVILGQHPHVLERVEWIGRTLVFYSLGNLIFDSELPEASETVLARVELRRGQPVEAEVLPLWIIDGAPRPSPAGASQTGKGEQVVRRLEGYGRGVRFLPETSGWWRLKGDIPNEGEAETPVER